MDDFRELYLSTKAKLTIESEKRIGYENRCAEYKVEVDGYKSVVADCERKLEIAGSLIKSLRGDNA